MKNQPQHSRYRPGQAGKSPLKITIAPDQRGYWHGTVWQRGPLRCLYSTGARVDQREAHAAVQQWVRTHGWHKP
jgi:hypothetical protein